MVPPDDQQVLAWRGVPAGRIVVRAALAHIHAFDDAVAERTAALDHSPAHDRYGGCGYTDGQQRDNQAARSRSCVTVSACWHCEQ